MQKSTPNAMAAAQAKTDLENKKMEVTFRVYKLNSEAEQYTEKRYVQLKTICQRLSSGNRSVKIVNDLLRVIFQTKDAINETNMKRQLMCVQMKFQVTADLAKSCKVSIQDLLRHASHKVYGCIT